MNRWVQGPIRTAAIWGTIIPTDNQAVRKSLRQRRRSLDPALQRQAAECVKRIISATLLFRKASRLAFYLPFDGEIDPLPLCLLAHRSGKQCYVPRVKENSLVFERYVPDVTPMRKNRLNIPEPTTRRSISAKMLDVVFMPLVAFDQNGNRLGMGKGYYDHTFANISRWWRRPLLVGLAHSIQQATLEPHGRDVPMDAIVTESSLISFALHI